MKTFIFALMAIIGMTLGAPFAEARDKRDKDHDRRHYSSKHHRYDRSYRTYRSYPRSYYYSAPRYSSYPRAYSSYRSPYYGNRYYSSRRPSVTFSFGL
jgi:hypothetical protein